MTQYELTSRQSNGLVIDSLVPYEQAMGDSVVPVEARALHAKIKPYLRVVPVVYHGYDGKLHVGQIVVHKYIVTKVAHLFLMMYQLGFPIKSVIPSAHFGYDDQASMAANNSSAYRPEMGSEHRTGAAIDLIHSIIRSTSQRPTRSVRSSRREPIMTQTFKVR